MNLVAESRFQKVAPNINLSQRNQNNKNSIKLSTINADVFSKSNLTFGVKIDPKKAEQIAKAEELRKKGYDVIEDTGAALMAISATTFGADLGIGALTGAGFIVVGKVMRYLNL